MVRMTRDTPATTQAARLSAVAAGTTATLMAAKLGGRPQGSLSVSRHGCPRRDAISVGRALWHSPGSRGKGQRKREDAMTSTIPASAFSAHPTVRPDWLAKRREPALEPDMPIVDPHHHLIDRPENGTYLLRDLLADIDSGHNVVATVYLEWLSMYRADGPVEMRPVGEIEFANGVAAMTASGGYGKPRVCAGIVGHGELTLGAGVAKVLEAMIAAGGGRFRGIRFISASDPDQKQWGATLARPQGWLSDPKVREGFAQLAPLGLSFDAFMYHPQLVDLLGLARP